MSMGHNTTTTAQGVVTIETKVVDGSDNDIGTITTTFRADATSGAATEGTQTMDTTLWLDNSVEGSPYAKQKALAAAAAAHFGEVGDYLDSLTSNT
jgi:hypothetical protein